METIIKGENKIVLFDLLDEDGAPLLLSSLTSLSLDIQQNGFSLQNFVYGTDHELEQGATTSQLKFELRSSLSDRFVPGTVNAVITTSLVDADFDVDQNQVDKTKIEIFIVE